MTTVWVPLHGGTYLFLFQLKGLIMIGSFSFSSSSSSSSYSTSISTSTSAPLRLTQRDTATLMAQVARPDSAQFKDPLFRKFIFDVFTRSGSDELDEIRTSIIRNVKSQKTERQLNAIFKEIRESGRFAHFPPRVELGTVDFAYCDPETRELNWFVNDDYTLLNDELTSWKMFTYGFNEELNIWQLKDQTQKEKKSKTA